MKCVCSQWVKTPSKWFDCTNINIFIDSNQDMWELTRKIQCYLENEEIKNVFIHPTYQDFEYCRARNRENSYSKLICPRRESNWAGFRQSKMEICKRNQRMPEILIHTDFIPVQYHIEIRGGLAITICKDPLNKNRKTNI